MKFHGQMRGWGKRSGLAQRFLAPRTVLAALAVLVAGAQSASGQCQIEMAKLLASDGAADDWFGGSVALSGGTLVVGASRHGIGGAAYVFYRDRGGPNQWGEVAKLVPSSNAPNDNFGSSVAIWGDTIAVGASNVGATISGAVYVFERDLGGPDNWGEVKELFPTFTTFATLGQAVAIWGDTIVGGAPNENGSGNVGAAYVFERNLGGSENWGLAARLVQSDAYIGIGHFASPGLSIWGDTIVAGAYGAYTGSVETGAVYVFERDFGGPGNWGEVVRLVPGDITQYDFFGEQVSLSADTLAVASRSAGGSVYLFERNGTWSELLKLLGVANDLWLDGDTLLVGRDAGGLLEGGSCTPMAATWEVRTPGAE